MAKEFTELRDYLSSAEAEVDRFLQAKPFADYIYSKVDFTIKRSDEEDFRKGKSSDSNSSTEVIAKIEAYDGHRVIFMSGCSETLQDPKLIIDSAKRNQVRVLAQIGRDVKLPQKSIKSRIVELEVPDSLTDELKASTAVKSDSPILASYELDSVMRYSADSNGIEVRVAEPLFACDIKTRISQEDMLARNIGIRPRSSADFSKVDRLIKYMPDITLDQSLRSSKDLVGLAQQMSILARNLRAEGVKVQDGLYDVISPYTTFAHEICGHNFEAEVQPERTSLDDNMYRANSIFRKGTQFSNEAFNLADSPQAELAGMKLWGGMEVDAEMFPTYEKNLVWEGFATGRKMGSKYADLDDVGNAKAIEDKAFPVPRMSTVMTFPNRDGPKTIEELAEMGGKRTLLTIKRDGLCYFEEGVFSVGDPESKVSNIETYLLENGRVVPVKSRHAMTGSVYNAIRDTMIAGPGTMSYDIGRCGRDSVTSDYHSWTPVSEVGPLALLSSLQVRTYTPRTII